MTTTPGLMKEDDLLRMPEDGYRYELVEGVLRQMTPTGYEHGRCTARMLGLLIAYVHPRGMGDVVAAETGFLIARGSEGCATVRAADVAFVAKGRVPADADTDKYLEMAPDLVVETLSPFDTASEVQEKIDLWLSTGVRMALTLDPTSRVVTVYRSSAEARRLTEVDSLTLDDVVPGFTCRVSEIFA